MSLIHSRAVIWPGLFCLVNACASLTRGGPPVQERPWRTYLGTPARASATTEAIGADPQPVWRVDVGRGIAGAPALGEDVVALGMIDRQVALLDRRTGEVLWRRRLAQHVGGGPLLADDRLFVATQDDRGRVYALRLTDGHTLWSRPSGDVLAPLAVDPHAVYAAALDGWVTSWDAADGTRRWRRRVSGAVRAAPLLVADRLLVATVTDSLFLLDAATGRVAARRATRGTVLGAPALADGLVVVATANGVVEVLDAATLAVRGHRTLDGPAAGHVAVRDGVAWVVTTAGAVWSLPVGDLAAGTRIATGLVVRAGPQPVADGVFAGGVNGELVLFGTDGQRRWSVRLSSPVVEPPLVEGGTIVATAQRGEVVVFR